MRAKYWETYFNPSAGGETFSAGRLVLDVYLPRARLTTADVLLKLDKTFRGFWKEICAAQLVSCAGAAGPKTLYNKRAWTSAPVRKLSCEGCVLDDHDGILNEALRKSSEHDCSRVKLGFLGDWINPYVTDGRQFRFGVVVTVIRMKNTFVVHAEFSKSSMWFADWIKPLFDTDKLVAESPGLPWRRNDKGVIAPDEKAVWENRWRVLRIAMSMATRLPATAAVLSYGRVKYDAALRTLRWPAPSDKGPQATPLLGFWAAAPGLIGFNGKPAPEGFINQNIRGHLWRLEPRHFQFLKKGYKALAIKEAIL